MTSSELTSFESLLDKTRRELLSQVKVEQPALLKEKFIQSIKFLRSSATCYKLVVCWLQVYILKSKRYSRLLTGTAEIREQEVYSGHI